MSKALHPWISKGVRLDPELYERVDDVVRRDRTTFTEWCREAIVEKLNRDHKKTTSKKPE